MSGPDATPASAEARCFHLGALWLSICKAKWIGLAPPSPHVSKLPVLPLIAIVSLFAGCVTDPPKPIVGELRTVTVEVPIKVACIDSKDLPPRPQSAMPPPDADIARKAAGAVADAKAYATYSDQLDAAMKACIAAGGPHE